MPKSTRVLVCDLKNFFAPALAVAALVEDFVVLELPDQDLLHEVAEVPTRSCEKWRQVRALLRPRVCESCGDVLDYGALVVHRLVQHLHLLVSSNFQLQVKQTSMRCLLRKTKHKNAYENF